MRAYIGQTPLSEVSLGVDTIKNIQMPFYALEKFIELTGISGTEEQAITDFYNSLQSNNLLDKMIVLYPFVGGSATQHSYNLINATEHQLTYIGQVTHSLDGVTGNGTNAYIRTDFNTTIWDDPLNSFGLSVYNRTNLATGYDVGSSVGGIQRALISRYVNNQAVFNDGTNISIGYASTASLGLHTGVSQGLSTNFRALYKNAVAQVTASNAAPSILSLNIGYYNILANNNTLNPGTFSPTDYSANNLSLVAFHEYLDASEVSTFYTIVQTLQTDLGRAV